MSQAPERLDFQPGVRGHLFTRATWTEHHSGSHGLVDHPHDVGILRLLATRICHNATVNQVRPTDAVAAYPIGAA